MTAESDSKIRSLPTTASIATLKPPSVCKEPSVLEVASVALLIFNSPAAVNTAAVAAPIVTTPESAANVAAVPL